MAGTIQSIFVSDLHDFPGNPFRVEDNEEMQEMMESIRDYGVISPLIVMPREAGGYEIIAGHRRKRACERAGIEKIPALVREMDRDAAVIALVDSNLHREHILPSERAMAYKMKLDAIKHQGQRNDLTSGQVVGKLESADIVGQDANSSGRQVQRYIRLTELLPPILRMVDEGKIAVSPAVELSYLTEQEQTRLLETMESEERTPSLSQARRMKDISRAGALDMDAVFTIMTEDKPNQKEQIRFPSDRIKGFFPKEYSLKQIEDVILKLLTDWLRKRQRGDAR